MRWLLLKDLQILRRSPLLVALLVVYPVAVSLLVGASVSGGPTKPRVAFANLLPADKDEFAIGGERLRASDYIDDLFETIDPIRVRTREEAIEQVRNGNAIAAFVIPADVTDRLQGTLNLSGGPRPEVEVLYNAENPAKRREVESAIRSRLSEANQALAERLTRIAGSYLGIITSGGEFSVLGREFEVLGLRRARTIIEATIASLPADAPERTALAQVSRFAQLAADNLDVSEPILASIGEPVQVKQTVVGGSRSTLEVYMAQVAVSISMMFVTLLLVAGMLAIEREEHAFSRLVRGLVSRTGLLAEKIVLGAVCAVPLSLGMLAILSLFLDVDRSRAPLWVPAAVLAALAFAAMGAAIGAVARDVRAASLLAFALCLPVAALALVPSGAVAGWIYDVISAVSAAFPFRPCLDAFDAAVSGGDLGRPLVHLAALALAFGLLGRLALRRFG
ncbi:MAG TPA: ABC transporter permease [Solirubrobacteraceae bacterium]|nr:ABC transporter permease [Solirubrobacteraceae bacterium]